MTRYIASRIGQALFVLWVAFTAAFLLLQALPGDAILIRFQSPDLGLSPEQAVAGQQIGVTGNVQPSGGCHLDLRINVADNTNPDVATLIRSQNETRIAPTTQSWNFDYVNPEEFFALWGVDLCPVGSCK